MLREEAIEVLNKMKYPQKVNKNGFIISNVNIENEALEMAIQALSQEPCDDVISREWLMRKATERFYTTNYFNHISAMIEEAPPVTQKSGKWIPVSERLPEDIKPVIVTWKNTDPKSYYQYIVGKHFIGTAHYKSGKWYWYSSVTEDLLAEYGKCDSEEFDEAIEVVAWMPLPTPYELQERSEE